MKALVTGGAGFIGSTLVDRLLADGHDVVVVDDLSSGSEANLVDAARPPTSRPQIDIRDDAATQVVVDTAPEVVFHLAAQADVRVSVARPTHDASINVIGLLKVLEGARQAGTRKVVFASSGGTIYGEPDPSVLPIDESNPELPIAPYGVAKKVGTDYLRAYQAVHGLDWTRLALANVYGPRQDPHGEAGVVAIFAGLLLDRKPCTVFGTGEQTRDYVYVDDVVDAFARAADAGSGELFNIGTGQETSVNALYQAMADAAGVTDPPTYVAARPGELDRSALDASKAQRELDWSPQVSLERRRGDHPRLDEGQPHLVASEPVGEETLVEGAALLQEALLRLAELDRAGRRVDEPGRAVNGVVPVLRPHAVLGLGPGGPVQHGDVELEVDRTAQRGEQGGRFGEQVAGVDHDRRPPGGQLVLDHPHLLRQPGDRHREVGVQGGVEGGDHPGRLPHEDGVGELVQDRIRQGIEVVTDVLDEPDGLVALGPDPAHDGVHVVGHGGEDLVPGGVPRIGVAQVDAVEGLVEDPGVRPLTPAVHQGGGHGARPAPDVQDHRRAAASSASR